VPQRNAGSIRIDGFRGSGEEGREPDNPAGFRFSQTPRPRPHPPVLRRFRLLAEQAAYFAIEAAVGFRRNGLMSVAAVTTVTVALLVIGTAVLLGLNLTRLAAAVEAQVQVVVFLRDGLSASQTALLQRAIEAVPGVASARFVGRGEALARLRARLGESQAFADLEAANPLPDSFEVQVADPRRARAVATALAGVTGVEEVTFGAQITDRLLALTRAVRMLAGLLTLFLTGVALIVVVNTIRLTVIARRREIEIMRLVGATRWFVQWPLLLEGVLEGVVAAAAATAVLAGLYTLGVVRATGALPFLPLVPIAEAVRAAVTGMAAAGIIVGAGGSLIAVRRFVT